MYSQNTKKNLSGNRASYRESELGRAMFGISPSLDRALEARLLNNLKTHPPASACSSSHNSSTDHTTTPQTRKISPGSDKDSDQDLLTIMASRLAKLEDTLQAQKADALKKDKIIMEQQKTNTEYKNEVKQLQAANHLLKSQIHEMETFLNDYGLVWVGNTDVDEVIDPKEQPEETTENSSDEDTFKDGASEYSTQFKLDMEKIKRNIVELNFLAGEGKAEVVHTKGGMRRLKEPDAVSLTFYKNGFVLFEGPFRPYNIPSSLPFVKDIMDGYFPYELKERYPNGVPFKLCDRSYEEYAPKQPFSGNGASLDGKNFHNLASTGFTKTKTKEEFLKKLPTSVIKNGRVVDIRNSVATTFKNKKLDTGEVIIASTDVINYMRGIEPIDKHLPLSPQQFPPAQTPTRNSEAGIFAEEYKGRPTTPQSITTLKIKTHNIGTLIVKLRFDDTISTLRKYIDKYTQDNRQYELRTTFPNQVYADTHITLQVAGLVPNATLYMKAL